MPYTLIPLDRVLHGVRSLNVLGVALGINFCVFQVIMVVWVGSCNLPGDSLQAKMHKEAYKKLVRF
jgi:hypothetical protein